MDFFSGLWSWFSGSSISSNLVKTALLGFLSKLMSDNIASDQPKQKDYGSRLQLDPSTDNKIPVLYGEAYFGGVITDAYLSSDFKSMTYVITLSETTGSSIGGTASNYTFNDVYLNNNKVIFKNDGHTVDYVIDESSNQDISMRDLVSVRLFKGTAPINPAGNSATLQPSYNVVPGWAQNTHPMTNLLFAVVEVKYNRSKNVTGIPTCTFHITNSLTLPGDVLNDYMQSTRYGASISSNDIDSSLVTLNSYATTGFSYKNVAGTVVSGIIGINGLIDTNREILSNMESIATACSSWISYNIHTGKWNVIINKTGTSIASFTDSNIIGEISISGTSLTQLNNIANVKYQNTNIKDSTDFVKISIPDNELFANEPRSTTQLDLPLTNKQAVAMKIGLQQLKQERIDKIINFVADYSYINIKAGDIIDVTSDIYGFTNKLFRVITTEETDSDSIQLKFTCLEYNSSVYDYDIQEYIVETDDGIMTQGNIGKPDVPTITKTEIANVPKMVIQAKVPSGIVDAIEYWVTTDTTIQNDSQRTYIKVGQFNNTDGSLLTQNAYVTYAYSGISQNDFYVKVRGVNNITTGPYSDPSGLIHYKPVVVADGLDSNSALMNGAGIAMTALGLMQLLMKIDELFAGDASKTLTQKVFDWFKDTTGVDLVGKASNGNLVVSSDLGIKNHGNSITAKASTINFDAPLVATGTTDVTVGIAGGIVTPCGPPAIGQVLVWDGSCWKPTDSCCDFNIPLTPSHPETCAHPPSVNSTLLFVDWYWVTSFKYWEVKDIVECDGSITKSMEYYRISDIDAWVAQNPGKQFVYETDDNPICPNSRLLLEFTRPVTVKSGNISIYNSKTGNLSHTYDISSGIVQGNEVLLGNATPYALGSQHRVEFPAGIVETIPNPDETPQQNKASKLGKTFSMENPIQLNKFEVNYVNNVIQANGKTVTNTEIRLYFNKEVQHIANSLTLHAPIGHDDIIFTTSNTTDANFDIDQPFTLTTSTVLDLDTEYYLTIPAYTLKSGGCGIWYDGLSDTDKVKFTTEKGPEISNSSNNTTEQNLIMDRQMVPNNSGTFKIYDMDDNLIHEVNILDSNAIKIKG